MFRNFICATCFAIIVSGSAIASNSSGQFFEALEMERSASLTDQQNEILGAVEDKMSYHNTFPKENFEKLTESSFLIAQYGSQVLLNALFKYRAGSIFANSDYSVGSRWERSWLALYRAAFEGAALGGHVDLIDWLSSEPTKELDNGTGNLIGGIHSGAVKTGLLHGEYMVSMLDKAKKGGHIKLMKSLINRSLRNELPYKVVAYDKRIIKDIIEYVDNETYEYVKGKTNYSGYADFRQYLLTQYEEYNGISA